MPTGTIVGDGLKVHGGNVAAAVAQHVSHNSIKAWLTEDGSTGVVEHATTSAASHGSRNRELFLNLAARRSHWVKRRISQRSGALERPLDGGNDATRATMSRRPYLALTETTFAPSCTMVQPTSPIVTTFAT